MSRRYTAFISYRHAEPDRTAAELIHQLIERYRIPRKLRHAGEKRFGYVFRDREELPVSSDLSGDIRAALDASDNLIVICTPNTAKSPWVCREIDYFLTHHDRSHVFAVLAAGEPAEVFPPALTMADASGEAVEPLALDIRAEHPRELRRKLRREVFRLYAALIGCPYDALMQRQQRRRRRIGLAGAGAVLTLSMLFSGMLLVKNRQIDLKNHALTAANEELTRQKAEILLRESELLTQSARAALAEGDAVSAARSAAAALPSGEEQRPYLADAEQVLIRALGIFSEEREKAFPTKTTVQMPDPVEDFFLSEDGARLLSVDRYGIVTCHDAETGELYWSYRLTDEDVYHAYLLRGPENSVIGVCDAGITSLSAQSGELLWAYNNRHLTDHRPVLSDDGAMIALMEQRLLGDQATYALTQVILSGTTGEEVWRCPLTEGALTIPSETLPYIVLQETLGAFSADAALFAGCYAEQTHAEEYILVYFVLDTETGHSSILSRCPLPGSPYLRTLTKLHLDGADTLIALHRLENAASAAVVEKRSLSDGALLWAVETPAETEPFSAMDPICPILTSQTLYFTRKNRIYAINTENGALIVTGTLSGNIVSMEVVEDRWLSFVTEDGTQLLGWRNDQGIFDSGAVFGMALELGSMKKAALWGGGSLRAVLDGERIAAVTPTKSGYGAVIPQGDESTVVLCKVICPEDISQQRTAALPEETSPWGLPNDAGELVWNPTGDLTLMDAQGSTVTLLANEAVTLFADEAHTFIASRYLTDAAVSRDGILAAACDGDTLLMWHNGMPLDEIPLPQELCWSLSSKVQFYRLLQVSGSGYVLLSTFDDANDPYPDRIAIYDMSSRQWNSIPCGKVDVSGLAVTPGAETAVFAALEGESTLSIYDIERAEVRCTADLGVPCKGVEQMEFLLQDRYVLVKTRDSQLLLADAKSGEIVFHQRLPEVLRGQVRTFADTDSARLYLAGDSPLNEAGLCLDTRSWKILAEIPGFVRYDPASDMIYRQLNGAMVCCRLPGTEELVAFTQRAFGHR